MQLENSGPKIEIKQGDISRQNDISAIVNAANAQLTTGGGVAGAIHRAAGPELSEACFEFAPIHPGEAVITKAFNLPNDYVIHCLGPVYGRDKPEDVLLANCYRNALDIAEKYRIESIAFPAISTGIFSYPIEEAATVILSTILKKMPTLKEVKRIRFVLFSQRDLDVFREKYEVLKLV